MGQQQRWLCWLVCCLRLQCCLPPQRRMMQGHCLLGHHQMKSLLCRCWLQHLNWLLLVLQPVLLLVLNLLGLRHLQS
jgi:hypothetical protein